MINEFVDVPTVYYYDQLISFYHTQPAACLPVYGKTIEIFQSQKKKTTLVTLFPTELSLIFKGEAFKLLTDE